MKKMTFYATRKGAPALLVFNITQVPESSLGILTVIASSVAKVRYELSASNPVLETCIALVSRIVFLSIIATQY